MFSRRTLDCSLLAGTIALTRILFRSRALYDLDSVDFALALRRFDPAAYQPHPPGYFLYVCMGKLLNLWFHDPNASLVALSIAASCAAGWLLYLLTEEWFGMQAARFAGGFFLLSPLVWFHGIVALTYIVEAFFSTLTGYVCWRIYQGSTRAIVLGGLVLGVGAGVRPSSLVFLAPLYLFSLRRAPRRKALTGIGVLLLATLAWFVPMVWASGGLRPYLSALSFLWQLSPGRQNESASFLLLSIARLTTIAGIIALCFGPAFLLFARALTIRGSRKIRQVAFTWMWIAPALLFFTFVFLRFINSGYLLIVFPPVCAWVAEWARDWLGASRLPMPVKAAIIGVAAAVNIAIFLQAPLYCSYRAVRDFEAELDSLKSALPRVATPSQTLLLGFDSHFLGFRHAGFYFPDYTVAEYPEVRFPEGPRVFTMQQENTRLVGRIDPRSFTKVLLFPLPPGDAEFRRHSDEMRALLPSVQTIRASGWEFMVAPIQDLPVLFPMSTRRNLDTAAVHSR